MTQSHRYALLACALLIPAAAMHARMNAGQTAMPVRLSDTGFEGLPAVALAKAGPGLSTVALAKVESFSPQYPLWSDGADKRRWVYLPPGTTIDASDPDRWVFPDGTKFWKEFSFGGRTVETRFFWKQDSEWRFATYVWNDEQTDAVLAPEGGLNTNIEVARGKRHRIPSTSECRACHVSDRVEVLGFSALQLSADRDPLAIHGEPLRDGMVTLDGLLSDGRLTGAPASWRRTPPRIHAPDPETRAVLGYLSTNCGSCHNTSSDLASLGFNLKASTTRTDPCLTPLATTLDHPGKWTIPSAPDTSRRIAPGDPDQSALLFRIRSRRPSSQMPPLGTAVVDAEAVARLTRWIAEQAPGLKVKGACPP